MSSLPSVTAAYLFTVGLWWRMGGVHGITKGMKTAVSIPDKVFQKAEVAAKRLKMSRSELYARAVDAYVDVHSPDAITEAINAALDQLTSEEKEAELDFVRAAAAHSMQQKPW